jgi:hypothetical protein
MPNLLNKSRISIGGFCPVCCDQCCDCEAIENRLTTIFTKLEYIDRSIEISPVRTAMSPTPAMAGLGASVISIGPTYNYWGIGTLTTGQSWGQTSIYLVTPAQFPELARYQGEPTIGTVWYSPGGTGVPQSMPILIDHTGIYIHPSNQINVNAGTTFKFTQALILVDPSIT